MATKWLEALITKKHVDGTKGNEYRVHQKRLLEITKKYFTARTVKHWVIVKHSGAFRHAAEKDNNLI